MIPVSANWTNAVRQQFRYQAYMRTRIKVVPPGLAEGLVIDRADGEAYADKEVLFNESPDLPQHYITCEPHRWLLDGTFKSLPDNTKVDDWWSLPLTESRFLQFTFDKPYTIPGIYVEWDLVNNTFPEEIVLRGFNILGAKSYEYTVTNITSSKGFIVAEMDDVKSYEIEIVKWGFSGWRCRINEIMFGLKVSYDSINNGRILSATFLNKSDPTANELPWRTVSTSLRNLDIEFDPTLRKGISKYLVQKQLAEYQLGFTTAVNPLTGEATVEWTDWMTYWVDSLKIPADSKNAIIDATSRLSFLTKDFIDDSYNVQERTLYDLAQTVLLKSDIVKKDEDEVAWRISDRLKQVKTTAYVPKTETNAVLQLIANASACWLHSDPVTDQVILEDLTGATPVQEVNLTSELGDPEIVLDKHLLAIRVGINKYEIDTEEREIAKGEYLLKGRSTLEISYGSGAAVEVKCELSGATQVSFTPYGTAAVLVVDAPSEGATVKVSLKGKKILETTSYIETYRDLITPSGTTVTIENPFITNSETAKLVSDFVLAWYNRSMQYSIPYIGYPELVAGDQILLKTIYDEHTVTTISNTIEFNGAFKGKLEAK